MSAARRFSPDLAGRLAGAGLLVATGAVHLDLYLGGYRTIPTIGTLFLIQVASAFLLAVAVASTTSWAIAAVGAGFALATLGGYLLSMSVGLFGFEEVPTAAGAAAGALDLAAFGVLATVAITRASTALRRRRGDAGVAARAAAAARAATGAGLVVASALLGIALTSTPGGSSGPRVVLVARRVGGSPVLTTPRGLTLYWFALDSPTRSRCAGTCAAIWPPLLGDPVATRGVTGRFGTIRRSDGRLQATYHGHPLYTFSGDSPGTARGNGLVLDGGRWYEMRVK